MKRWFNDKKNRKLFIAAACLTIFEWLLVLYWSHYGRTMWWGGNIGTITWFPSVLQIWTYVISAPVINFLLAWLFSKNKIEK